MKLGEVGLLHLVIVELLVGYIYMMHVDIILSTPAVLVVVPALMSARGNIYGTIVTRLVTRLHLGLSRVPWDARTLSDVRIALLDALTAATAISTMGVVLDYLLGGNMGIYLYPLAYMAVLVSSLFVIPTVLLVVWRSFKRGYAAEYVAVPVATATSDLVTPIAFFLAVRYAADRGAALAVIIISLVVLVCGVRELTRNAKFFLENAPATILGSLTSGFGGFLYSTSLYRPLAVASLGGLPGLNALLGALGGIVGSAVSVQLHKKGRVDRVERRRILKAGLQHFALGLSLLSAAILILGGPPAAAAILASGILASPLIMGAAYFASHYSYKRGIDPDNIVVPITTALGDVVGPLAVILLLSAFTHQP